MQCLVLTIVCSQVKISYRLQCKTYSLQFAMFSLPCQVKVSYSVHCFLFPVDLADAMPLATHLSLFQQCFCFYKNIRLRFFVSVFVFLCLHICVCACCVFVSRPMHWQWPHTLMSLFNLHLVLGNFLFVCLLPSSG